MAVRACPLGRRTFSCPSLAPLLYFPLSLFPLPPLSLPFAPSRAPFSHYSRSHLLCPLTLVRIFLARSLPPLTLVGIPPPLSISFAFSLSHRPSFAFSLELSFIFLSRAPPLSLSLAFSLPLSLSFAFSPLSPSFAFPL